MAIDADLLLRIRQIWEAARVQAARSVNTTHVVANWLIGQQIVEAEQGGSGRAEYGTALLRGLSRQLSRDVGSGFSISALQYMRAFYLTYPGLLYQDQTSHVTDDPSLAEVAHDFQHALRVVSAANVGHDWHPGQIHSALSWTHYRALLKVNRREARDFYEIEAVRNGWSARQLERQINSLLFERLLKSQDKDGILALANEGLVARAPIDVVKDPYVLEFLDLPESHRLVESQLEAALISQLQDFLLELGSGFAFIGRQVRLTLDGDHFYPDLVFYHVKLKCYVVIDLKVGKLSHGDLGQMQMYVHFYDQEVVETGDNPTIGLVLCTDKNDAVVRYVLGDDARQIFASGYLLQLPSEETLRAELRRELERLDPPTTGC
ncbi:MAG: PDDEXK nuclease domain-containing protein [Chloroflexota bacterium]